jgi:alkylation response protein AidB-like acyl-CoA dehydrogenase
VRFGFSEEQRLMQKSLRELLERECTVDRLRAVWSRADGRIPGLWSKLAELGVLGVRVPVAHGGAGLSELDLVLLLEEAGRAALPEPFSETVAVAAPCLAELGGIAWLERISVGAAVVSVSLEPWPYASHARSADLLLHEQAGDLYAIERPESSEQPSVDGSRRLYRIAVAPAAGERLAHAEAARAAADAMRDRAAFAAAAELIGLGARMLELSVDYAKTRHQFDRPIGSFQAVQHLLADALVKLEFARPLVYRAAYSLSRSDAERSLHASMAKAAASDAARFIARAALQVHGAIGYSYEYHLQLFMKRAWSLASAYGDAAWHRERCARLLLEPMPQNMRSAASQNARDHGRHDHALGN